MVTTREKTAIKLYTGAYCPFCRRVKGVGAARARL